MKSMIMLVELREGVSLEDYEDWVLESYAPAARSLPSVREWQNYRVTSLLGSEDAVPPYQYVVTVGIDDMEQLGRDIAVKKTQKLLAELQGFAEVTQLMSERFV